MYRHLLFASTLILPLSAMVAATSQARAADKQVAHMVFFKLKDSTPEGRAKLVAACKKYLSKHDGTVYFSAGVIAEDFQRAVNDRDFDVALHVVFKNKEAHDTYQDHERHKKFIDENKDTWATVRVFDSYVEE